MACYSGDKRLDNFVPLVCLKTKGEFLRCCLSVFKPRPWDGYRQNDHYPERGFSVVRETLGAGYSVISGSEPGNQERRTPARPPGH